MVLGLALLVGMYGCPGSTPKPPPPPACETDADCDDGVFCNGAETCDVESGDCLDGTPPCAEELCVEEDDMCLECLEDADCTDDGNFCTGDPVCNEDNTCGFTGDPCEEGETCNEDADRCEVVQAGADFAGENPDVNFDALVAGEEIELNAPLPEGDFTAAQVACTFVGWTVDGAGTFDPADATPTMYTPAADDTEVTATWDCGGVIYALTVDITITTAQTCETDADCDDGLFCNGIEICGTNGFCEDGELPCDPAGFTCEEGDDAAVCVPIAGPTVKFTLNIDNLTGTAQADTFIAGQELAPGTATSVPTLQNGDTANGLAGTDTLKASYSNATGADVTIAPTLTGIEILEFTNFGGANVTTISGTNFTGVQEIYSVTSLANTPITGVAELTDLGVTNSDFDLAVTFVSPATNANDDLVTLYLNGTKDSDKDTDGGGADTDTAGCAVNITTPVNGIEALHVVTEGSVASYLEAIIQTTGTTLLTLTAEGEQALIIDRMGGPGGVPLPGTLTTINLTDLSGGSDLTVGGATNLTYTGGSGDDVINLAGTYTTSDTLNGGTGTNTLGVNTGQAAGLATNQTNVTNFTNLLIPDALNGALTVSRFGCSNAILDTTLGATALTAGASTITLPTGSHSVTLNNDDTAHTLGITVDGTATTDTLTVNLYNADLGAALTATGAETVEMLSANGMDGTAADGNANTATAITLAPTFGAGTLKLTGTVPFTLTGAITAGTIDASGLGGALTMAAATVAGGGATITGTPYNDILIGSDNSDQINGGAGNDTITGGGAVDLLTGGDGADIFVMDDAASLAALLAARNTINDFVVSADKYKTTGATVDVSTLTGTDAFATAAAIQDHSTSGNLTVLAATSLVRITVENVSTISTDGASVLNALVAGAGLGTITTPGDAVVLFSVYDGTNTALYIGAADTGGGGDTNIAQAEISLIATFSSVNHTAFTFSNFLP